MVDCATRLVLVKSVGTTPKRMLSGQLVAVSARQPHLTRGQLGSPRVLGLIVPSD